MMKDEKTNLSIYEQIKDVPKEAQKPITGGRLKGMTDIKPMWRIEKLTELFGPAGFGWKTKTISKTIIDGANNEKIAVVDIELYVKQDGEWSEPIEGSGGSAFVTNEKSGLYTSDECFKMAYTDALSVACKALGMGASIYWGDSKYITKEVEKPSPETAKDYKLNFGKYKGLTLSEIDDEDCQYLEWLLTYEDCDKITKEYVVEYMKRPVEKKPENDSKDTLTLLGEFTKLVNETNTNKEKIYEHFGVDNNTEMSNEQLREAINIMKQKKVK